MAERLVGIFLTAIVLALIVPVSLSQVDFVTQIFNDFGFASNSTQQVSSANLSRLVDQVLDGRAYNQEAQICEENNCTAQQKCYTPIKHGIDLSASDFVALCPKILFALTQECIKDDDDHDDHDNDHDDHDDHDDDSDKPPTSEVWGYGFLCVTIISLCSLGGIAVLPVMNKSFYSTLLMFLIALGVGALVGNGLVCLIPEAFEIGHDQEDAKWRASTVVAGVYMFFVIERIIKLITSYYGDEESKAREGSVDKFDKEIGEEKSAESEVTEVEVKKPVATVAWMIIFGDAFHNFIDGLSIGAAFSKSTLLGVSVCLAVFCEELPHELGDFAILLNAGMTKKKALLFNFLSACTCYLGLIIGITISEVTDAAPWILALAGGMFLYIALADMMPEMNRAAEEHKGSPIKVFLIQNAGFLCGFALIVICEHFGHQIQLDPHATDHHDHH